MISIAILGSDSTHSQKFGDILRLGKATLGVDVKVKALWGENPDQAYQRAKSIGLERNAPTIEHALDGVDLVLVLGRFGDSHALPAKTALCHGIATFVDKPFLSNLKEAKELVEQARKAGVMLTSASALRFANELKTIPDHPRDLPAFMAAFAPANCTELGDDPRLNSVFFYGIHALEMLLQVMGSRISDFSVFASSTSVSANLRFATGDAVLHLIRDADEFYEINWYGKSQRGNLGIALDGTYNLNLLRALLKSFLEDRLLVDHASTLLAIEVLVAMEHADLSIREHP